MENTKQPYELSLWDDIVIPAAGGNPEHFEETKIAIIGASNMDTPIRAYNVSLKENINGERTLTFQINYKYYENGELKDNPFLRLLKNERKLKLRVGTPYTFSSIEDLEAEDTEEKWVDFIIKDSDKNSDNKSITFIAKEAYVNELGKNGWSVLLSTELENNYGTINELGGYILEGSDWVVGQGYSPTEKAVEPLFRTTLSEGITAKNTLTGVNKVVASEQYIYPLYSSVEWNEDASQWKLKSGEIQFLWAGRLLTVDDANDDRVIIDEESTYNCVYSGAITTGAILMTGSPSGGEALNGNKIVKTQSSRYESILGKYVKDFETLGAVGGTPAVPTGGTVFGYPETEYITSSIVQNYLTNASNVTSALAWSPDNRAYAKLLPEPTGDPSTWLAQNPTNYLAIPFTSNNQRVENEGPENSRLALNKDSIYVVRMKARWIRKAVTNYGTNGSNILTSSLPALTVGIRTDSKVFTNSASVTLTSNINTSTTNMDTRGYANPIANKQSRPLYTGSLTVLNRDEQGYVYVFLKATDSSRASTEKLRFFINNAASSATHDLHIEDVQLFDYKEDNNGTNVFPVFPGDIPTARVETKDRFYWINGAGEVEYLSSDKALYAPIYRDQYESVRNIEVKESNYFNNIQSLAELFEVWAKFKVYHRKNGKLLLVDNLPKKEVVFSKYSPNGDQVNYTGFKYGINLKGIKRNLESNSLSTKVIVKNNNQQFAVDGMASISRAHDNPSGENEIYNFNYFVNQGLLDYSQVLADLYGMTSTDMAVLTKLKKLNAQYVDKAKLLQSYENEIAIAKSYVTLYEAEVASATEEESYLNYIYSQLATGDPKKEATKVSLAQVKAKKKTYTSAMNAYKTRQTTYEGFRDSTQDDIDDILIEKKLLKLSFYKKYSRFIQEGTWTDDKYIDDDLYYLDASKVASVAAFPKLSYTIDVIDVEGAQGFEGYKFRIGERTYVEDPEFFGHVIKNTPVGTVKTPYKQEVIVSERIRNLDDPSKSSLTIKSYKSQSEELFQKIKASANQLQYEGGGYQRAAAAISPLGEIDQTTLAQSFANNAFVISSAQNQNVIWDTGQGIEIINNDNSSERMRIVAGGIFLSTDGGRNWTNGISGLGINTRYLLAGQIDASKINIVQGNTQYFRWDTAGLSAFYVDEDNGTYDITRFVRFNQYGIYGTTDGLGLEQALSEAIDYQEKLNAVKEHSNWSLTWDGLFLQIQDGAVSLDPINGLEIFNPNWLFPQDTIDNYPFITKPDGVSLYDIIDKIPVVSLGRFYDTQNGEPYYGLRMRNKKGEVTLRTESNGNLWLANLLTVGSPNKVQVIIDSTDSVDITRLSSTLTFSIDANLPIEGNIRNETTGVTYAYTTADYVIDENSVYQFTIPADAFDTEHITITDGTFPLHYGILQIDSYRFLGINGAVDPSLTSSEDPIILYAGDIDEALAPFRVFSSGKFEATEADITGVINATSGIFSGSILVGGTSGINGSDSTQYAFWAGETDPLLSPKFYVTPEGNLYAESATIYGSGKFSGIIEADSGYFTGTINAESGSFLGPVFFGTTQDSYVGVNPNNELLINIKDGRFGVGSNGDMYGDSLMLVKNSAWNTTPNLWNQYNILIGLYGAPNYIMEIFNSATTNYQEKRVFGIKNDGSVAINGTLNTDGDLTFAGSFLSTSGIMRIDGRTGTIIVKTPDVDGWGIYEDGHATFSNVNVRGKISSTIFEYANTSSISGELLISPSIYLLTDLIPTSTGALNTYEIPATYRNETWENVNQVKVNILGVEVVGSYSHPILTISQEQLNLVQALTSQTLPMGTQIISTSTEVNSITLSARDADGAYISIKGPGSDTSSVLIGNLAQNQLPNSARELFGNNLGYGLFAENAYLTGKVYLPQAGMTDENNRYYKGEVVEGKQIRIWAGESSQNMEDAPFIVTQDGCLYAAEGVFNGQINAKDSLFSGYLIATGVLIDPDQLSDHFFVTSVYDPPYTEPNPDTYIIDINRDGLHVWNGGFHIYSDFYSGWRGYEKPENPVTNKYYGYEKDTNPNPWPMLTTIDDSLVEDFTPHLSSVHQHIWFIEDLVGTQASIKSTKLLPSSIGFSDIIISNNVGFETSEKTAWDVENSLTIGRVDSPDLLSKWGIQGNEIVFTNGVVEAFTIEPIVAQVNGQDVNNSVSTVKGLFNFGNSVQVSQKSDGIIFTYIGKE